MPRKRPLTSPLAIDMAANDLPLRHPRAGMRKGQHRRPAPPTPQPFSGIILRKPTP